MLTDNMDQVLKGYYRWAATQSPLDIGYPHAIPTERLRGAAVSEAGLSDTEALWVNYALARLSREEPEQFKVIRRVYRDRKSIRWMHNVGEGTRLTLGRDLASGMQFVRGVLVGAGWGE